MVRPARFVVPLLLALVASACVSSKETYPSLARRAGERATSPAPLPSEQAASAPTGDLSARTARLLADSRAAHADFAARRGVTEHAVAAAGPLGSESWASASTALAAIEAAHDVSVGTLAELDQLESDHRIAIAGDEDANTVTIAVAHDEVTRTVADESGVLGRLRARLGT